MKKEIENVLLLIFRNIGMDRPNNFENILEFCYIDVQETADGDNWTSEDVIIAFRRWIEQNQKDDN